MKLVLSVILGGLVTATFAQEIPSAPPPSLLQVQKAPGVLSIGLHDPDNRSWSLQKSYDLRNWTTFRNLQVANTTWNTAVEVPTGTRSMYVRAVSQAVTPPLLGTAALKDESYRYTIHETPPFGIRSRSGKTTATSERLLRLPSRGASLGRVLFYDKRLSKNNTVSCASCHQQEHAFADPRRVSIGFNGKAGTRNAPSLINTNFEDAGHFFWDRRAQTLEEAVLLPIQDPDELGLTLDEMSDKISSTPYYSELFKLRFGTEIVTPERVSVALSQFLRSIVSINSRFDEVQFRRGGTSGMSFTELEQHGLNVYFRSCYTCHVQGTFQSAETWNTGFREGLTDLGLGGITGLQEDNGRFKIPTLRNVALTAPYMHDGRFETLEEVIDHYSEGIAPRVSTHPVLRSPGFGFSDRDKKGLKAFLETLTDYELTTNPSFSDPFIYGESE